MMFNKHETGGLRGADGQQLPMIVDSCIRYLNQNGLHHLGLFRVSGMLNATLR